MTKLLGEPNEIQYWCFGGSRYNCSKKAQTMPVKCLENIFDLKLFSTYELFLVETPILDLSDQSTTKERNLSQLFILSYNIK